jgi:uncharacterized protein (DUF1015 family)
MLSPTQRKAARKDPLSFRNAVGRGVGASLEDGVAWLDRSLHLGALRPMGPAVIVYRQGRGDGAVTGIVADVSLDAYESGLVKPHEKTIAKTERKMAEYMRTTRIYGNPIALTHRPHAALEAAIQAKTLEPPVASFTTADGVPHEIWLIEGADAGELCRSFDDALYVTDGHHRLAGARRVAAEEGRNDPRLPAGLFSPQDLTMRSFARCIADPDLDAGHIISRLSSEHVLEEVDALAARPRRRGEFGVRIRDRFFRLRLRHPPNPDDIYGSLDVTQLQRVVLGPIFGIADSTRDKRLQFVADLLQSNQPDSESDVWLLPFPVEVGDMMAVADSGQVMPPKSTWLAPKVPNGLVIRTPDER